MERKFLDFVAEIMECDRETISMDTEYRVYERWDSVMMLTLVMEMEVEYGIGIPLEAVNKIKKLSDLYEIVKGE